MNPKEYRDKANSPWPEGKEVNMPEHWNGIIEKHKAAGGGPFKLDQNEMQALLQPFTGTVIPTDSIVEAVREDLLKRSQLGIKKYGTTLDRTDMSRKEQLQHAYEECLDLANYLKKLITEEDKNV